MARAATEGSRLARGTRSQQEGHVMNEELTKKLIEYLNASATFIGEQAPEVISQALHWWAIYHALWLPFWLIVVAVGAWGARRVLVPRDNHYEDFEVYMGTGICALVSF